MKKLFLPILALVLLSSCKKETEEVPVPFYPPSESFQMVSECNTWHHKGGYFTYKTSGETFTTTDEVVTVGTEMVYTRSSRKYYFDGDTVIDARVYKKMYFDAIDTTYKNAGAGAALGEVDSHSKYTEFVASFRQEGSKVYYKFNNMEEEALYADMSANIGEVLNYKWNYSDAKVESISYRTVGKDKIRVYKLSNGQFFLEGIGGTYGLFKSWGRAIHGDVYLKRFTRDGHEVLIEDYM